MQNLESQQARNANHMLGKLVVKFDGTYTL